MYSTILCLDYLKLRKIINRTIETTTPLFQQSIIVYNPFPMNISINGEQRTLEDGLNLQQLISILELENKRLAIEVNQEIIPRSEHASYTLKQDDKVEIVQAIGGG